MKIVEGSQAKMYRYNGTYINPVRVKEKEIMEKMGIKSRNKLHKIKKKFRQAKNAQQIPS